jgi:hypothetical protein
VLHLENLGDTWGHAGIREPMLSSFQSLRSLTLGSCQIKRRALQQLINQSPNLEEAVLVYLHYDEEEETEIESCLHIISKSLKHLHASISVCEPVQLVVDAPNLTSLNLGYSDNYVNLRTPNLLRLWTDTENYIDVVVMEHLQKLVFKSYCSSFRTDIPDILRYTPNLVKLTVVPMCADEDSELMSLDLFLTQLPKKLRSLELNGQFLRGLNIPRTMSVESESITEIELTECESLKEGSVVLGTLRRLKVLRKACLHLEKLSISHECPDISLLEVESMFEDVPHLEVITNGYSYWTKI